MAIEPPKIDERTFSRILEDLRGMVPHYTPEWSASKEQDGGVALLKIFSRIAEAVIHRFNQTPRKSLVAFLDMLGIKLLPARAARVPLVFTLAKGTEKEILIPARTQAVADKTAEHDEVPFETEQDLLATPSQLKKAVAVDPGKDAIYLPCPDFLSGDKKKKSAIAYSLAAASSAGSTSIQPDHVTDLKKGDFLRVDKGDALEYVIISGISATVLTLTDKLEKTHGMGAAVEKLSTFPLFEGKNMQEHGLYIGHKDLFNVKSTARFSVAVSHRTGTTTGVQPLKLAWEYWGEVKGEEGKGWRPLEVLDGTTGLGRDGTVVLDKTTEGEIKEEEINGTKSRWIRCLVREPLPPDAPRLLPVLDRIELQVKSSGTGLIPDQAFSNDTPLDVTQPFTPFGTEPRMYDVFTLAHKEAFSKKKAGITLDVSIEKRGIVGPPAAIAYGSNTRVFARGSSGRLTEIEIDTTGSESEPVWTDHEFPPETKVAEASRPGIIAHLPSSAPGPFIKAAVTPRVNISAFVRTENGHLAERTHNGQQWQWTDHGTPGENISVGSDPSAIFGDDTVGHQVMSVFVVGTDGNLYGLRRSPETMTGNWICLGKPAAALCEMSPHVVLVKAGSAEGIVLRVFVSGKNGHLYEAGFEARSGMAEPWIDNGMPDSKNGIKSASSPFAWVSPDGSHVRAYVTGTDHDLWEFDNTTIVKWAKKEHPGSLSIDSGPHGYLSDLDEASGRSHIFVRASDGTLWEWDGSKEEDATKGWMVHQAPVNTKLTFGSYLLTSHDDTIFQVFSATSRNTLAERWIRVFNGKELWNQYRDPNEKVLTPSLSWEYWNGKGWIVLKGIQDGTANLLKSGTITFDLPQDIDETDVAGQKSYWVRARIVGGDYGKESFALVRSFADMRKSAMAEVPEYSLRSSKKTIRPPIVKRLSISYELKESQLPQSCLTYNNLDFMDQTEANKLSDKFYVPFVQLEDKVRTLYAGFGSYFKGGPVRLFFGAKELSYTEEKKPKMQWMYRAEHVWKEISCLDATEALIRADILELLMQSDFSGHARFGAYLYWMKGSLTAGEYEESPLLEGIYTNATWALQAETVRNEILGSSDGSPDQSFTLHKFPIQEGEEIYIQEVLTEEEKKTIKAERNDDAISEVKDEKGEVTETWVLWKEVTDLSESGPKGRHYTVDRARGEVRFGDGKHGMIPPAGDDNIKARSYQAGGGANGNIGAWEVKTLKSALAGVDKAANPACADGGADTATLDEMIEIGPAMISHRNRAVTVEDFERLAREASRKVVKARCLPNRNNKGLSETGWVRVIIVPDDKKEKPFPSLELRRKVKGYLEARCPNSLVPARHVSVAGPLYIEISVFADVYITSSDAAARVERAVNSELNAFFHPLTGGPEGKGWDFGRDVSVSDVYAMLESLEGVDHVENLRFTTVREGEEAPRMKVQTTAADRCKHPMFRPSPTSNEDIIEVPDDFLVANGMHEVEIRLTEGGRS